MTEGKLIIWHDGLGGEANVVECLSYEGREDGVNIPPLGSGDFAIVEDSDQQAKWMAQVIEPQRNLPLLGLSRESPSEVSIFERILLGEIDKSIFLRQVYYYRLQLIGEVDKETGRLTSVHRRPRAGSIGSVAKPEEVRKALDLPAVEGKNIVGRIHSTEIPIAMGWSAFKQHALVAGATGSGKSNTVANLIKAAQSHKACVIIYDQKPDYQHIDRENDERHLFKKWGPEMASIFALENTGKYCLWQGNEERDSQELPIAVRSREVSVDMLVNALFYQPDEGNQRDTFRALLRHYKDQDKEWTLGKFRKWVADSSRKPSAGKNQRYTEEVSSLAKLYDMQGWGQPNDLNIGAMLRKIPIRQPKWLDSLEDATGSAPPRSGIWSSNVRSLADLTGYFTPLQHLAEGKVIVIRTNAEGREYGLFLSYILRQIYDLKRSGQIKFPIVNIVDEAQDIFQGGSAIRDTATFTLNEIIRKGRSKDISFVIAVQSVSQIPDSVLINLNSRFIHRQNSIEELRLAIPSATRELMTNALTFGSGEALVSIIGARAVVHAEMAPSPFELTKTSISISKTLADQDDEALQTNVSDVADESLDWDSLVDSGDDAPEPEYTEDFDVEPF